MNAFDPDAPARPQSGIYGLDTPAEEARVRLLGVPFDATTSYRQGTSAGPQAILEASHQVDLWDAEQANWAGGDGRPYSAGIHFEVDGVIASWNSKARALASPIIERGGDLGADPALLANLERVNALGADLNQRVGDWTVWCLAAGQLPGIVGGDHSVPFGAISACAEARGPLGILHFDAHADLRVAYEGFEWSHASILHNVLKRVPGVERVLSVGLRDLGESEERAIVESGGRVTAVPSSVWAAERLAGRDLTAFARRSVAELPENLWISVDIDGLDPTLCPNTGTPVPGGLLWDEILAWFGAVAANGRRVVGFDMCEVNPGHGGNPGEDSWDAIIGARLLYKLIGLAVARGR